MISASAAALLGCVLAAGEAAPPEGLVLLDCRYPSAAAARAAWRPAEAGTPPVEVAGETGVKLPANFSRHTEWRVAWDVAGTWDLSNMRSLLLEVRPDGDRGASLLVYLHSGAGWYSGHAYAPSGGGTVRLRRKEFSSEGRPGGWGGVDRLRLAVLRHSEDDRSVVVSGIRADVRAAQVAIYRNDAGVGREEGVGEYVRLMADSLDRLALGYQIVDDKAVAAGALAGRKVAILPLNPVLPADAAKEIRRFVDGGGKLLVCYHLPEPLGSLLGVRAGGAIEGGTQARPLEAIVFQGREDRDPVRAVQGSWIAHRLQPLSGTRVVGRWADGQGELTSEPAVTQNANGLAVGHVLTHADPTGKDRLLLEMLGGIWGGAWKEVCDHRLEGLGRLAGMGGPAELSAAVRANAQADPARKAKVLAELARAEGLARDARAAIKYGDMVLAAEELAKAQQAYRQAYGLSVPARPGEFRAVWCHDPAGVAGWTWDRAIQRLSEAGFNAILPNMCWGNAAAYKSDVLPEAPLVAEKGDQLAECLAAAKKHGVAVHVWRVNWRLWWRLQGDAEKRLREAGRLQQDPAGQTLPWLCPSHPANRQLEIDAMVEIARKYDVAGIHFDYIRYPGPQGCYCPGCRSRFEAACKVKVERWPDDVRTGPLRERYLQFRRDNITAVVAEVARQARQVRPGVLISAAVFHHWPTARDEVAQDWKLWVERGYLDFVCPMQYTHIPAAFEDWTRQSAGWIGGRIPLMPGIGATLGQTSDGTLQQIQIARQLHTGGFVLFDYNQTLASETLELLKLGATAEPTSWRRP